MANFPWLPRRLFEQEDRACIFDFHPSLFIGPLIKRSGKVPFDFLFDLGGDGEHSEMMCTSSSWRCKNMNSRISATCEKPQTPKFIKCECIMAGQWLFQPLPPTIVADLIVVFM